MPNEQWYWVCPHCGSRDLYAVYNVPHFAPLMQGLDEPGSPYPDYDNADAGDADEDTYACFGCNADNITPRCVQGNAGPF